MSFKDWWEDELRTTWWTGVLLWLNDVENSTKILIIRKSESLLKIVILGTNFFLKFNFNIGISRMLIMFLVNNDYVRYKSGNPSFKGLLCVLNVYLWSLVSYVWCWFCLLYLHKGVCVTLLGLMGNVKSRFNPNLSLTSDLIQRLNWLLHSCLYPRIS